jgi:hypothetical protein
MKNKQTLRAFASRAKKIDFEKSKKIRKKNIFWEPLNIYRNYKESLLLVKNKRIEKISKNLRRGWKKKKKYF